MITILSFSLSFFLFLFNKFFQRKCGGGARGSRSPPFHGPWYVGISRSIFLPGCKFRNFSFSNKRIKWAKISENYVISALFVNHRYGIRNKPRLNSISPKLPPPLPYQYASAPPPPIYTLLAGKLQLISLTFLHSPFFSFPFSPLSLSLLFLISLLGLLGGGGRDLLPHPRCTTFWRENCNWCPPSFLFPLLSFPLSSLFLFSFPLFPFLLFFDWGGGGGGNSLGGKSFCPPPPISFFPLFFSSFTFFPFLSSFPFPSFPSLSLLFFCGGGGGKARSPPWIRAWVNLFDYCSKEQSDVSNGYLG